MKRTRDKRIKKINAIFMILLMLCILIMFMPVNYTIEYDLYGNESQDHTLTKVEYVSDSDFERYKADDNKHVIVPYSAGKEFEEMDIYANTTEINMTLKWNDWIIKKFSDNLITKNGTVEYGELDEELPDYPLEELIDRYSDNKYMIIMVVCADYNNGMTDSIKNTFNDLGIDETPMDTGESSSFYAVINRGKLVKAESSSIAALYYKEELEGHRIDICSGGQYVGNWADIIIDDKSYCSNGLGLNVAVYDLEKDGIVDSVVYQNYSDSRIYRNIECLSDPIKVKCSRVVFDTISANINIINILQMVIPGFIAVMLILIWNMIRLVEKSKINNENINKAWFIIHQIILALLLMFAGGIAWGYRYLAKQFENVSISQLLFHMTINLGGTNWSDFKELFIEIGGSVIFAIVLVAILSKVVRKRKWGYRFLVSSLIIAAISFGMVGNVFAKFNKNYGLYDYAVNSQIKTNLYDVYYVDPAQAQITFPEKKKNLIYMFFASLFCIKLQKVFVGCCTCIL